MVYDYLVIGSGFGVSVASLSHVEKDLTVPAPEHKRIY